MNTRFEVLQEDAVMPIRATKTSCGYDFYATEDIKIPPQTAVKFKTGIAAHINDDEFLMIVPRSSIGIKRHLMLSNTVGVIDSDFINGDTKGNIIISLYNYAPAIKYDGDMEIDVRDVYINFGIKRIPIPVIIDLTEENTVYIQKGERVAQGIILNYNVMDEDNCSQSERTGGVGSSGK